jgi:DNA (cytosine-5)-methyltransferase 1
LIFVGVRNDLARKPAYPTPLPYRYAVREVLGGERYVHDTSGQRSVGNFTDRPAPTITVGVGMGDKGQSINSLHYRVITKASYDETTPRVYPGTGPSPAITASGVGAAHRRGEVALETPTLITHDPETGKDLRIDRFAIGREYAKLQQGEVSRKYLNLIRGDESRPAFSVTATGGQVAAAGPVHATVARKFTLGELRRLCAFPDDFVLKGTYEQRWERLGRAVPPVMMREIALAVKHQILDTLKEGEP